MTPGVVHCGFDARLWRDAGSLAFSHIVYDSLRPDGDCAEKIKGLCAVCVSKKSLSYGGDTIATTDRLKNYSPRTAVISVRLGINSLG